MSTLKDRVEEMAKIVELMNDAKDLWRHGLISESEMNKALETLDKVLRSYMGIVR
jgi:hypothetical protein